MLGLPSEPGRGLCQDLPLDLELTVLPAQSDGSAAPVREVILYDRSSASERILGQGYGRLEEDGSLALWSEYPQKAKDLWVYDIERNEATNLAVADSGASWPDLVEGRVIWYSELIGAERPTAEIMVATRKLEPSARTTTTFGQAPTTDSPPGDPHADIAVKNVVGFAIGPDPAISMDSSPLPPPSQPLERLVAAYNQADSARWEGDTAPPLFAMMELADGTRITIWFSGEFPEGCAQVGVLDPRTGDYKQYRVESPDLLPAVLELAGDSIDRELLEQLNGAPWLPK